MEFEQSFQKANHSNLNNRIRNERHSSCAPSKSERKISIVGHPISFNKSGSWVEDTSEFISVPEVIFNQSEEYLHYLRNIFDILTKNSNS